MKQFLTLIFVLILCVSVLTGCSGKDMNSMKEDVSEVVSDAKENLNDMVDNATVSDDDGHIGETKRDETSAPTDAPADMTEDDVTGEGIVDDNGALIDDPTDAKDMTVSEDYI